MKLEEWIRVTEWMKESSFKAESLKISSERDPKVESVEVRRKKFGGTCFKIPYYQANMPRRGNVFNAHGSTPEHQRRCVWSGERGTNRE